MCVAVAVAVCTDMLSVCVCLCINAMCRRIDSKPHKNTYAAEVFGICVNAKIVAEWGTDCVVLIKLELQLSG